MTTDDRARPLSERVPAPAELPPLPAGTAEHPVRWRPLRRRDARALHRLQLAAGRIDHPEEEIGERALAEALRDPRFTPARDGVIGLAPDGSVVAVATASLSEDPGGTTVAGADPHIVVSLDGTVHPAYRGRGIGRALLDWQSARGMQLLATSRSLLPGMLAVGSREACVPNTALFAAGGFAPVRWWCSLRREVGEPVPRQELPQGMRVTRFRRRYSEPTRVALNEALRDHWGFAPISRTEWRGLGAASGFAPGLSRLVVTGRGTRRKPFRVEAFALTAINRRDWRLAGSRFGYLETVGVAPARRGQGLARVVIAEALRAYRRRGLEHAVLDVDSADPNGELGVYERLGFTERDRAVMYARRF